MCPYGASGLSCLRTRVTRLRTYSHLSHLVLAVRGQTGCLAASFFLTYPVNCFWSQARIRYPSPAYLARCYGASHRSYMPARGKFARAGG
ncbi:hypothetical protein CI102_294 [Trichoderma harzianum]|nr:hypothetical protein CI102_294 [Trichoderma harzianum]